MKPIALSCAAALALGIAACGGAATVTPKTADATSAIAAAEAVGAQQHAEASAYMKLARDELAAAKELMRQDEPEKAQLMLERAQADAELALLLVRRNEAKTAAQRAQQQVQNLDAGQ